MESLTLRNPSRRLLRSRAEGGLQALLGVSSLDRKSRRLVSRAYANAAYRLSQGLHRLSNSKYAFFKGQVVVLNESLIKWVANGS